MSDDAKEFFTKYEGLFSKVKASAPNTVSAFGGMFAKIMGDGALSGLQKEFVALGIGVAGHCEPCIRLHVKKCLDAGATREQIMEAASVAVMMAGGPAFTHLTMVVETLDALQNK
jgi:AhpD family alkylhydroperoxidase